MLIKFSFKNFKSFKNENCLDMEATSLKEHEYNVAKIDNNEYLKVSAIYGANASGKTNVIRAFDFMRIKVLVDNRIPTNFNIEGRNINSYMMNDEPISLEVEMLTKNKDIYRYGFSLKGNEIISEWLQKKKINKFYDILERENDNAKVQIGGKYKTYPKVDKSSLFLSIYRSLHTDDKDFKSVFDWFVNVQVLNFGEIDFEGFMSDIVRPQMYSKIINNKRYKEQLVNFIKAFDFGIEDIKITSNNDKIKDEKETKMELIHRGRDGKIVVLPLDLESSGTIKMINLFDFLIEALKEGQILFIDELDAKLHPLLTRYIINLFHNSDTNIGNGQLIYSTHDTVNLNKDTFRRDEIWFTEKNRDGVSEIYALSDYILEDDKNSGRKVRNDATYNKDYLTGRYGAIPVLEEFEINYEK